MSDLRYVSPQVLDSRMNLLLGVGMCILFDDGPALCVISVFAAVTPEEVKRLLLFLGM